MPQTLPNFRVTYFTSDRQRRVRIVPAIDVWAAADVVFAEGYEVFSSVRISPPTAAELTNQRVSTVAMWAPKVQPATDAPDADLSPAGMLALSLASALFLVLALLLWAGYEPLARLVSWAWRLS